MIDIKSFQLLALAGFFMASCHSKTGRILQVTQPGETATLSEKWQIGPFNKIDNSNPILIPSSKGVFYCPLRRKRIRWEIKDVFNPAAVSRGGKIFLIYRAQDSIGKPGGTSRLGVATSIDGVHFIRNRQPIFFPANDTMKKYEWEGGCEDPRIIIDSSGSYLMTYTAYDGKIARLAIARSKDLLHWTKLGLAFGAAEKGKYRNTWSKSGSIVCKLVGVDFIAQKIDHKYWMYWGDDSLKVANSIDLINWNPLKNKNGKYVIIAAPRKGRFDSRLCEPGPPAILTKRGILLLYNGMNLDKSGDLDLAPGTYSGGQVFMDKNNPTRVLERLDAPFIKPDKPFEITGQVSRVCFIEGLVAINKTWLLYYGTADSKIAVAIADKDDILEKTSF